MPRRPKNERGLQHKHRLFADEYLMNGNRVADAYIAIYPHVTDRVYASKAGSKIKMQPEVTKYIEETQAIIETNYKIRREDIVKEVFELIDDCKRDGDRSNYIKLLDMLNKMSGQYVTKQEVELNGPGIIFNFVNPDNQKQIDN